MDRRPLARSGYPRRRSVTACLTCRERKKKCDNVRPTCGFCTQIGARCIYESVNASSFDPASLAIMDRLSVIEGLLRAPSQTSADSGPLQFAGDHSSSPLLTSISGVDPHCKLNANNVLRWPVFAEIAASLPQFSFRDSQGNRVVSYIDSCFDKRSLEGGKSSHMQATSDQVSTDPVVIGGLVDSFFQRVHAKNPILNRELVSSYCQEYCALGPCYDDKTCLVLVICALGAVATNYVYEESFEQDNAERAESLRLGNCYFEAAQRRLGIVISRPGIISAQCLCLAGIYYMYVIEPISALHMFHTAGTSIKLAQDINDTTVESQQSLFWACLKSERELLVELPIMNPALTEYPPYHHYPSPPAQPASTHQPSEWTTLERDSWYYLLSEIALRRITDKICEHTVHSVPTEHFTTPSSATAKSLLALLPLTTELETQVRLWRDSLPTPMQFPDYPLPAAIEWQHFSRSRYHLVLTLLYRPFLCFAIHDAATNTHNNPNPNPIIPPVVSTLASRGLENVVTYILHGRITHRHHGRWFQMRNQFVSTCLLLAAARSGGVEMPRGWYRAVEKMYAALRFWEMESAAFGAYRGVLEVLDQGWVGGERG